MKHINKVLAVIGLTIFTIEANATSQLPAGVFTNLSADATDTVSAVVSAVVPVGVTVAVIWSAVSWAKRGTKAATK